MTIDVDPAEYVWVEDRGWTTDPAVVGGHFCRRKGCRDEHGTCRVGVAARRGRSCGAATIAVAPQTGRGVD